MKDKDNVYLIEEVKNLLEGCYYVIVRQSDGIKMKLRISDTAKELIAYKTNYKTFIKKQIKLATDCLDMIGHDIGIEIFVKNFNPQNIEPLSAEELKRLANY
ncbi:hypothetical protein D929_00043 [Enterococcus faecalis 02-MB-P-10]|uniref:hypothetical protein n=1 Tax=Enterococcus faecalis TaxID=1351 RepID=UPI0003536C9F|nr:hypothetical protein [Enterococcus faecalis]EPH77718.1 hypothetical protein D929_00043 [Enterococcus faecalis 02-MB-P-10]